MSVGKAVGVDQTRQDIRHQFLLWDIDPSEFEILWEEERDGNKVRRLPGARVRYMRGSQWQEVACYGFITRAQNLRQCFLLLERLRIAEQHGVQYEGLTFTKELVATDGKNERKQSLDDAFDILGVSFDDPTELIKEVYLRKSNYYHPDKGGDADKFKRITDAFNLIMKSRNTT